MTPRSTPCLPPKKMPTPPIGFALVLAVLMAPLTASTQTMVGFDDLSAPCSFSVQTDPVDGYIPASISMDTTMEVLSECGQFGVSGQSSPNFLAWNSELTGVSFTATFPTPVHALSLEVGSSLGGLAIAMAFDPEGFQLSTRTVALGEALTVLALPGAEIGRVVFSAESRFGALDNIRYTIGPPNRPPFANGGALSTDEDTEVDFTLSGSDPDSDPLMFQIVWPPALGSIIDFDSISGRGVYRPDPNAHGEDSFLFFVSDGRADSNTAPVSIDIAPVNDAPVLAPPTPEAPIQALEEVEISFIIQATDIDGDPLVYGGEELPVGASIDPDSGRFVWVPGPVQEINEVVFSVTASDGQIAARRAVTIFVAFTDTDLDGVADRVDNCPADPNADQNDADSDGQGDACDEDDDNDSVRDRDDAQPLDAQRCRDDDRDGCDDCASGRYDTATDGLDSDLDGLCDLGDPDLDGDGVDNGGDNCPEIINPDQLDGDGDGVGDVCDDSDDGDLESCGDGRLQARFGTPLRCLNPWRTVHIASRAAFEAWAANPVTHAVVVRPLDFGLEGVSVDTGCVLSIRHRAGIEARGDVRLGVGAFDFRGAIVSAGRIEVRAEYRVIARATAHIEADTVAIEAPVIDERADVRFGRRYCLEAHHVAVRHPAKRTAQEGDVSLTADFIDILGDFVGAGRVSVSASVLLFHRGSWITHTGGVSLAGRFLFDFQGRIAGVGDVDLSGQVIDLRKHARIEAAGDVLIIAGGFLNLHGDVRSSGLVSMASPHMHIARWGDIRANEGVELQVRDLFELHGEIEDNGAVSIEAGRYLLGRRHDLRRNASCVLTGIPLLGSAPARGCDVR